MKNIIDAASIGGFNYSSCKTSDFRPIINPLSLGDFLNVLESGLVEDFD
jgi:hypothetical protein